MKFNTKVPLSVLIFPRLIAVVFFRNEVRPACTPSSPLSPCASSSWESTGPWGPACQSFYTEVISTRTERGSFLIIVILLYASLGAVYKVQKNMHLCDTFWEPRGREEAATGTHNLRRLPGCPFSNRACTRESWLWVGKKGQKGTLGHSSGHPARNFSAAAALSSPSYLYRAIHRFSNFILFTLIW